MKNLFFGLTLFLLLLFSACSNEDSVKDVNDTNTSLTLTSDGSTIPSTLTSTQSTTSDYEINPKSWMSLLNDDLSLADITIPGTHDSAAFQYNSDSWSKYLPVDIEGLLNIDCNTGDDLGLIKAQSKTIQEQLELGVRWFDLRVTYEDQQLLMTHGGCDLSQTLGSVLETIKEYTKNHHSETALIVIKQEGSDLSDTTFSQLVYHKIEQNGVDNFLLGDEMLTLGEARGKVVVFRRFKIEKTGITYVDATLQNVGRYIYIPDMDTGSDHNNGYFKYFTQDYYKVDQGEHDETSYWYKVTLIQDAMTKANENKGRLYLNYTSAFDMGLNDTNRDVAKYINEKVDAYAKSMKGKGKAGSIFINFAGTTDDELTPNLVKHIIEINDFSTSPWSQDVKITSDIGSHTSGGGITMGDMGDGENRLLTMYIDNPDGENTLFFQVSNPIQKDGSIVNDNRDVPLKTAIKIGSSTAGAGVTMGNIDDNTLPEVFMFFIDSIQDEENKAYYVFGPNIKKIDAATTVNGYNTSFNRMEIPGHYGKSNSGAGITMGNVYSKDTHNLIIFYIDNPEGENLGYYKVSSDIHADGSVDYWDERINIPGHFGSETSGAGITMGDIDGDGGQNLIISFIDNPSGENGAYYMVSSNIKPDGSVDSWSERKKIYGWLGSESEAAGITMGDMDEDNREDLIFYFVDNPDKENSNYYKVGLNKSLDASLLLEAY